MRTLAESTLTAKEQLTVPRIVRRLLGVQAGDSLVWALDERGMVVVQVGRPHTLADIRAAVAAAGPLLRRPSPASVRDMKAGIGGYMRRKHARG